ncbi:glycoside hydrolase family 30 protein [Microbacterium sp.]|uniref:glycoside hydrolase family 30 protein n=1 Tax=Microbacterium sp. TaxID=51671 RepID=UPI0039E403CC
MTATSSASWVVTTRGEQWRSAPDLEVMGVDGMPNVISKLDEPRQAVQGFGACFSELGWTSLGLLDESDREDVLRELFAPGGAGLGFGRMPIGANDFSRDWYSYDETPGDFALEHFSIEGDLETLVPFIRAAQRYRPDLRMWASPWSPPTWMKTNGHYAAAVPAGIFAEVDNGITPEQVGAEGTDLFRLDEQHLAAYAAYFGRFIDAYREAGIRVEMVMPQNEFNSAQPFPSCTWTPDGLRQFVAHLGPEMRKRGVEVFLGTLERADDRLAGDVLADPVAGPFVSGLGLQWEGKKALAALHRLHPGLTIYQTEQECGDGRNDWRYAWYAWRLMKHFLAGGANAYMYWNISLEEGGVSRWGWTQNSLVVVDPATRSYRFTPDYYVLKHVAAFVQPGARFIDTWSFNGFDDQLVFANPDGSSVVVIRNDVNEDVEVNIMLDGRMVAPTLPADSLSTIVVPPRG